MYKKIVLAYDGSESGQQALLDCHEIAQWSQAELTLIAVMPLPLSVIGPEGGVYDPELEREEKAHFQEILDAVAGQVGEARGGADRGGGRVL